MSSKHCDSCCFFARRRRQLLTEPASSRTARQGAFMCAGPPRMRDITFLVFKRIELLAMSSFGCFVYLDCQMISFLRKVTYLFPLIHRFTPLKSSNRQPGSQTRTVDLAEGQPRLLARATRCGAHTHSPSPTHSHLDLLLWWDWCDNLGTGRISGRLNGDSQRWR